MKTPNVAFAADRKKAAPAEKHRWALMYSASLEIA